MICCFWIQLVDHRVLGRLLCSILSRSILLRILFGTDKSKIPWYLLYSLKSPFFVSLISMPCFHSSGKLSSYQIFLMSLYRMETDVSILALMASAVISSGPVAFPFLSALIAFMICLCWNVTVDRKARVGWLYVSVLPISSDVHQLSQKGSHFCLLLTCLSVETCLRAFWRVSLSCYFFRLFG